MEVLRGGDGRRVREDERGRKRMPEEERGRDRWKRSWKEQCNGGMDVDLVRPVPARRSSVRLTGRRRHADRRGAAAPRRERRATTSTGRGGSPVLTGASERANERARARSRTVAQCRTDFLRILDTQLSNASLSFNDVYNYTRNLYNRSHVRFQRKIAESSHASLCENWILLTRIKWHGIVPRAKYSLTRDRAV